MKMKKSNKSAKETQTSNSVSLPKSNTKSRKIKNNSPNQNEAIPEMGVTAKFLLDELMKKIAESGEELSQMSLVNFMKLLSGLSKTFPEIQSFLQSSDLNSFIEKRNKEEKILAEKIINNEKCLQLATELLTALNGKNGKSQ
jgi:hypothetical protein